MFDLNKILRNSNKTGIEPVMNVIDYSILSENVIHWNHENFVVNFWLIPFSYKSYTLTGQ